MTLRLLYMSAQTIWMMTFTQIMAIWTPGITLQDHLNQSITYPLVLQLPITFPIIFIIFFIILLRLHSVYIEICIV